MLMCDEWGDKSQITAIALAANYNAISIILGGTLVSDNLDD
jgi:putative Ca2+/H+ antiporter (TMEM165/GDT1 family)